MIRGRSMAGWGGIACLCLLLSSCSGLQTPRSTRLQESLVVSLELPPKAKIGEDFTYRATLTNTGSRIRVTPFLFPHVTFEVWDAQMQPVEAEVSIFSGEPLFNGIWLKHGYTSTLEPEAKWFDSNTAGVKKLRLGECTYDLGPGTYHIGLVYRDLRGPERILLRSPKEKIIFTH